MSFLTITCSGDMYIQILLFKKLILFHNLIYFNTLIPQKLVLKDILTRVRASVNLVYWPPIDVSAIIDCYCNYDCTYVQALSKFAGHLCNAYLLNFLPTLPKPFHQALQQIICYYSAILFCNVESVYVI